MSFKYGYMAQKTGPFSSLKNRRSLLRVKMKKGGSRAVLWSQPTPYFLTKLLGQPRRAVKMLDSPAARNQVNDGDNQCDHK